MGHELLRGWKGENLVYCPWTWVQLFQFLYVLTNRQHHRALIYTIFQAVCLGLYSGCSYWLSGKLKGCVITFSVEWKNCEGTWTTFSYTKGNIFQPVLVTNATNMSLLCSYLHQNKMNAAFLLAFSVMLLHKPHKWICNTSILVYQHFFLKYSIHYDCILVWFSNSSVVSTPKYEVHYANIHLYALKEVKK